MRKGIKMPTQKVESVDEVLRDLCRPLQRGNCLYCEGEKEDRRICCETCEPVLNRHIYAIIHTNYVPAALKPYIQKKVEEAK